MKIACVERNSSIKNGSSNSLISDHESSSLIEFNAVIRVWIPPLSIGSMFVSSYNILQDSF